MELVFDQKEIAARIEKLIFESKLTPRRFAIEVGIDTSNFSRKLKGTLPWTVNDVNKISEKLRIRKGWLLDGEGQMMKAPDEILDMVPAMPTRSYDPRVGVPYYNIEFELGFNLLENDQTTKPDYMIDFEPYNKCDCWCRTHGNSMFPTIAGGDIIALKEVYDPQSCLINDEIYAVITTNNLRTIKRVRDNGDSLVLIPDNKDFSEQTISKKVVRRVFKVIGCVKMF